MKYLSTIIFLTITSSNVFAQNNTEEQANEFIKIYSTLCLKNVINLNTLRTKLSKLPTLPSEKASSFLASYSGKAWPIPSKNGHYVIAIPDNKDMCSVFARQGDTKKAKSIFNSLVSTAPKPLISEKINDTSSVRMSSNLETLTYMWSLPDKNRGILFKLTSNSSNNSNLKLMASASVVSK